MKKIYPMDVQIVRCTDDIKSHIENVKEAWRILKARLETIFPAYVIKKVDKLIVKHDKELLEDDKQFEAYRRWKFPAGDEVSGKEEEKTFIETHRMNSRHHLEYYGPGSLVPEEYLIQIVCELMAFSVSKKKSYVEKDFNRKYGKCKLEETSKDMLETLITLASKLLCEEYSDLNSRPLKVQEPTNVSMIVKATNENSILDGMSDIELLALQLLPGLAGSLRDKTAEEILNAAFNLAETWVRRRSNERG